MNLAFTSVLMPKLYFSQTAHTLHKRLVLICNSQRTSDTTVVLMKPKQQLSMPQVIKQIKADSWSVFAKGGVVSLTLLIILLEQWVNISQMAVAASPRNYHSDLFLFIFNLHFKECELGTGLHRKQGRAAYLCVNHPIMNSLLLTSNITEEERRRNCAHISRFICLFSFF